LWKPIDQFVAKTNLHPEISAAGKRRPTLYLQRAAQGVRSLDDFEYRRAGIYRYSINASLEDASAPIVQLIRLLLYNNPACQGR
jgi:hypothetical protein